jgi:hypothetical protein
MADSPKPAYKQLRELRRLAEATGTTFTPPRTRAEASRAITALRGRRQTFRNERHLETDDVVCALRGGMLATSPRDDEIVGFGSSARWATSRER